MATEANAIDIKDLCFSFPGSGRILHDISITVPEGDFLAIIGPNGGGKTTLLRLILGLLKPDSGSISVLGESPAAARSRAGYVPQVTASRLGFPITVMDTVLMGMLHTRGIFQPYNSDDRDAAQEKLELLRVTNLAGRRIGDLSGGQRQRVYIARALASDPELLLLDEPAAGVDPENQENFFNILKDINSRTTIVMTTHDVGAVSSYISRIACLNVNIYLHDGRLTEETLAKVYGCPFDLITHGVPHRVLGQQGSKEHHHD